MASVAASFASGLLFATNSTCSSMYFTKDRRRVPTGPLPFLKASSARAEIAGLISLYRRLKSTPAANNSSARSAGSVGSLVRGFPN